MRVRGLLTLAAIAIAVPAFAQSAATYAIFNKTVAETKKAMLGDPQAALAKANALAALAAQLPKSQRAELASATAQWLQAEALIGINAPVRAAPLVDSALATAGRAAPNTKLQGDLMRSRGAIAAIGGQAQAALKNFQGAYEIFRRAGERRSEAIALQDIGEIYREAGDHSRVLQYYSQSEETFHDDPTLLLTGHNNRAQVLREMKRYPEAVAQYRAALSDARKIGSALLETRILTNLAAAQIDAGQLREADASITRALRLSSGSEAKGWRPFVLGVSAKLAAARKDDAQAVQLLEAMFGSMDLSTTPMPFREFHQIASGVYHRLGRDDAALTHLQAFQRLDDEARKLSASTNAQLMAAKFDFTNQNLRISQLKQGQLKRDIELQRQRNFIFEGLLAAGAIVAALLLASLLQMRRSRNQLARSNTALGKALAAKTEFLATTSHEIRTPLNGILGMTQVLLADTRIDTNVRSKVEVVHGAGEAMKALVDDILDVAKMENGELSVVEEETDLSNLLVDAERLWRGQAEQKGIGLSLDVSNAPQRIVSDTARLRQIVFNLMSNATKFTLEGSVTVTARTTERNGNEILEIEVRDTGIGIDPIHHEMIFDPFQQVDGGTDRRFSGTGLGLSICRRLAHALGGTISVESAVDVGSTFTLQIPLLRVPSVTTASAKADGLQGETVALLERNLLNQAILRSLIAPAVGQFITAVSCDQALDVICAGGVDQMVVEASSFAGDTALSDLRDFVAAANAAKVRTIVLFAESGEFTLASMATIGAVRTIAKPVAGADLLAALSEPHAALLPDQSRHAA